MTDDQPTTLFTAWPEKDAGAVFLTSFTFHAPFFELRLLSELLKRGAHPVVVFVDRAEGYEAALASIAALGAAGRDYHLLPVARPPYTFHPKVHLFCGAQVALVGSGNLTPSGTGGNLEAFDRLTATQAGTAVAQVRAFFRALLQHHTLHADDEVRRHLLGLLPESGDPKPSGDALFLHTLDEPLHARFAAALVETSHSRALFAAPFHDGDHETTMSLWRLLGEPKARIAAQADAAPSLPPKPLTPGALDDGEDDRSLHAKVIHAVGKASSMVVVGSANLTRAAWEGRNVEAVVVRQALDPTAFDAWMSEHEFRPAGWVSAVPVDKLPPSLPLLPLEWAVLHGQLLTAKLTHAVASVRFTIESGTRAEALEMRSRGGDLWEARIAHELHQAAVLRASAPGHSPAAVVISQIDRQFLRPREARLRDAISRMGEGDVDEETRRELLACLGDLFASMAAPRTPVTPTASAGAATPTPTPPAPAEKNPDDAVEEVEALLYGRSDRPKTLIARLNHLLAIVDLVTGMDNVNPVEPNQWRPELLDRALRVASPSQFPKPSEPPDAEKDPDNEATEPPPDPSETDRVPAAVVDAAIRLTTRLLPMLRKRVREDQEGCVLIYESLLRLLRNIAVQCPNSVERVVDATLRLLEDAFAVGDWPQKTEGYWLALESPPLPNLQSTERVSLLCVHLVEKRSQRTLDVAKRVALGIAKAAARTHQVIETDSRNPSALVDDMDVDALRSAVASHLTRGELALAQLEPLWRLEQAWSAHRHHQGQRTELEKRRARRGQTTGELAAIDGQLAALDVEIAAARAAEAAARRTALATPPLAPAFAPTPDSEPMTAAAFWDKTPARRIAGRARRLMPARGNGCSSCHMELLVRDGARLEDPRAVVRCIRCNLLIAAGPPAGVFDE